MECPICIEPLNSEETVTTECNHTFHKKCLENWNSISKSCPYCRRKTDGSYISEEEKIEISKYVKDVFQRMKGIVPNFEGYPITEDDIDKYGYYYRDLMNADNNFKNNGNVQEYKNANINTVGKLIDELGSDEQSKNTIMNVVSSLFDILSVSRGENSTD